MLSSPAEEKYGNGDVEQQDRPARMGEKRGELATRFAGGAGNKERQVCRQGGLREPRDPRNGNADPAVLQNIDGDAGAAEASSVSMRRS